ncbi:hypothetical protein PDQ40_27870 [Bacillus cereus group sp. Bc061]|uniref:hypothetical protein n=1 Tax=Bacillus cereus group sp. Bc061 TaxID=3018117 RepID=UPI0022E40C67|nr:hypothetical protein [Bacillus cereus group sp. Bc061]MDA2599436.1 hypothetical protein [Bacillus cereus group sp. Bc061]
MEFKDVTIGVLKDMSEEEVIKVAMKSFLEIPNLDVDQKVLDATTMYRADFDLVKRHIKYDFKNFLVTYPYVNEQEDVLYNKGVFSKGQTDFFPMNNYFISVRANVTVMPFGMLEVVFIGEHVFRNSNDYRHYKANTIFETTDYFYFDFIKQEFVQVNESDLNNGRKLKVKNESAYVEKTKKHIQEYIKREELLEYTKQRLKVRARTYQERFRKFKGVWGLGSKLNTFTKIEKYFEEYINFLEELEVGLQLKLIYSKLTNREFLQLEKIRKDLLETDIPKCQETLHRLVEAICAKEEKYQWDNIKEFNLNSLDDEDLAILNEFRDADVRRLLDFVTPRSMDFNPSFLLQGYIGYDLTLKELYPNLAQLEKREMRTDKMASDLLERERKKMTLDRLEQHEAKAENPSEEKEEEYVDGWFTLEELTELIQLSSSALLSKVQTRRDDKGYSKDEGMDKWKEIGAMKKDDLKKIEEDFKKKKEKS